MERSDIPLSPLVFMVPAAARVDLDPLRDLTQAFNSHGLVASQFAKSDENPLRALSEALENPNVDREAVVLLGVGEGADLIAQRSYEFNHLVLFRAAILLSPSVGPFYLNQFTCPYLILHDVRDQKFEDAVLHHRMRYGDTTTAYYMPELFGGTQELRLNPLAIQQIFYWLGTIESIRRYLRTAHEDEYSSRYFPSRAG